MDNAFGSNVVNAAGGVVRASSKSIACQAFRVAVKKWCDDGPGNRDGSFNDYFFRALKGKDPKIQGGSQLASQLKREAPMLADKAMMRTLAARAGNAARRAKRAPTPKNLARAQKYAEVRSNVEDLMKQFKKGILTDSDLRRDVNQQMGRLGHYQIRYPDALYKGHPVEIKGPEDDWGKKLSPRSKATQKGDYQKARKDGKVVEVSCKGCGGDCAKGNRCPPKPKN